MFTQSKSYKRQIRTAMLAYCITPLLGCAQLAGWDVKDLKFERVEPSDTSHIPPESYYSHRLKSAPEKKVLKIIFSTKTNLWEMVDDLSINLWSRVRICDN